MPLTPLTYGAPTDKCGITVRFGIEKGFFRDEGIELSMRVIYGGPELAAAYHSGEIPVGEMGSPPCVTAISGGADIAVIGSGVRRKAHMYLAVPQSVRGWPDLKGKKIGLLSKGSCPDWFLRAMLRDRGIDPDSDLSIVGLNNDYARVVDVVAEGRIDAMLAVEPAVSVGEARGLLKVLQAVYEDPAVPQIQWIVRVANRGFLAKNRGLVDALLRACNRSAKYASENVEAWIDFSAAHYKLERPVMATAIRRDLPHLHFGGELDMQGLERVLELQKSLGGLKRPITLKEVLA
jgi:ABC-type nitrate/sulfonate/bicarbonate transport system substrate-binding protein